MEKILACNYIDVYYPSKTKKLNLKLKFGMECYYVLGFYVLGFIRALSVAFRNEWVFFHYYISFVTEIYTLAKAHFY